jgi:hypothetical protein
MRPMLRAPFSTQERVNTVGNFKDSDPEGDFHCGIPSSSALYWLAFFANSRFSIWGSEQTTSQITSQNLKKSFQNKQVTDPNFF